MLIRENGISTGGIKEHLKVVIVGGSIASLTLAHCLHHLDIDFVVLEGYENIAPQLGASIVICPNGSRILDQLGIADDIFSRVKPLLNALTWTGDGKIIVNSNAPLLAAKRTGYPFAFMQRRDLLKVLFDHIPDKTKVHTSKRVHKISHSDDSGVLVRCEDGTEYSGDIVVGGDGIHSTVRGLMQQHIETLKPGATEKDRNSISAEYSCIFGISSLIELDSVLRPGDSHRSYSKNQSSLSFIEDGGVTYWFLFSRLERRYYGKDIPRYNEADVEKVVKNFYDMHMTDTVTYKQVWEARTFANMTCVEESKNEHWTADRFVCIGDAIHKMTPNLGAGGNAAIESAAALANCLARLRPNPPLDEIRKALQEFYNKRSLRANLICDAANQLTRIEALATPLEGIMALHVIPLLGDFLTDITTDGIVGAELLESLPPPAKSLRATMPWDPEQGIGMHEKKWLRALYALPLLAIGYAAHRTLRASLNAIPFYTSETAAGQITLNSGATVPLVKEFFGLEGLDSFITTYVAFFTPSIGGFESATRMQMIGFLADLLPLQVIWIVESLRRGNFTTVANLLPTVFGVLYQIKGIGIIAPIYYFLHYVQSPLENYHAADNRLCQIGGVKTIIPSLTISYILPSIIMFAAPSLATRQFVNGLWQIFPIYTCILQHIFGKFVNDTTHEERITNPEADIPYLRQAYGFGAVVSACAYLYVRFTSPVALGEVFFSGLSAPTEYVSLIQSSAKALRYNQISAFGAGAIWTMLSFGDLKSAGKLQPACGWGKIVGIFAGITFFLGPGAAMVVMWAWREDTLAKRKVELVEKK